MARRDLAAAVRASARGGRSGIAARDARLASPRPTRAGAKTVEALMPKPSTHSRSRQLTNIEREQIVGAEAFKLDA